jgi:hypothetical protein
MTGISGYMLDSLPNWDINNQGHSGYRTDQINAMYSNDVTATAPNYAFVLMGTNDILQGKTIAGIEANITTYTDTLEADGITVIINTVPPGNWTGFDNDKARSLNTWIKAHYTNVIDLYTAVVDPSNSSQMLPAYTYDGLHLSGDGIEKWNTVIDYTVFQNVNTNRITFNSGQTTQNIVVHLNNVEKYTGNKSFNITLSNPVNATLGENITAEITILDTNTLTFNVSASQTTITESNTTITLTVTKNIISDYPANVTIATADGTATAPADYTAIINQVLTFAPSELTKTVILSIKGDVLDEDDETFTVALSNPTGNATLGTPSSLTITIISRAMEPLTDLADRTMNLWILLFVALLAVIASMIIGVIFLVMRNGMPGPEAIIGIGAVAIALGVMVIICFVFIYVNGTLTNLLNGLGM